MWLDGRLVIPLPLQVQIETRIHFCHHGKKNMFEAARDVWYPYMYRSLAATATYCQQCTDASENLKTLLPKGDVGKVPEPREPNECLQLEFCGPISYLNESRKYVLVATDRFSKWPSAMVTTTNTSDKVLKFSINTSLNMEYLGKFTSTRDHVSHLISLKASVIAKASS